MDISVLGCGRWGTFISWYLNKIGHNVTVWGRKGSENLANLIKNNGNDIIKFGDGIKFIDDLEQAIFCAKLIIISINAQNLRDLMQKISKFSLSGKTIVLCMKGIEESTGKRLTQVVEDFVSVKTAIWVGPGHVQDFARGIPNCMVIDSLCSITKKMLVDEFKSDLIRFYYGNDLVGNELGAAAKNVMGIAAGILEGLGYDSLKGALMARGSYEISRIIKAMGGNELTVYGLCHLGDYQATLFSKHSYNLKFGKALVTNEAHTKVAEGVSTSKALVNLSRKYGIKLPICETVCKIIFEKADSKISLMNLFMRGNKDEF